MKKIRSVLIGLLVLSVCLATIACGGLRQTPVPPVEGTPLPEEYNMPRGTFALQKGIFTATTTQALAYCKEGGFADGTLAVTVQSEAGGENGIVFGLDAKGATKFWTSGAEYYCFYVSETERYAYLTKVSKTEMTCASGRVKGFEWNTPRSIAVERDGATIYGYVDGVQVLTYTDENPFTGKAYGFRSVSKGAQFTAFEKTDREAEGATGMEALSAKADTFTARNGHITTTSAGFVATYNEPFVQGTLRARISPEASGKAGIFFCGGESGYYYFHLSYRDDGRCLARLVKQEGTTETKLVETLLSTLYAPDNESELKVVLNGERVTCYLDGVCYAALTLTDRLNGTEAGVRALNAGTLFRDLAKSDATDTEVVDVVLFGHSHLDCWELSGYELRSAGRIVNMGIGGTVVEEWLPRVEEIVSYGAKKYVCWLGANDIGRGIPNSATVTRMTDLFDGIRALVPDAEIYVMSEFYQLGSRNNDDFRAKIDDINARFTLMEDVVFVDVSDLVLGANGRPDEALFRDSVHLKVGCYGPVAERLLAALQD